MTTITDEAAIAAVTDWLHTREHAAVWAVQQLREVDPSDTEAIMEARRDPTADRATAEVARWHSTRVLTPEELTLTPDQIRECWLYYADQVRRSDRRAMTGLDNTPAEEGEPGQDYHAAMLAHLRAVDALRSAPADL